MLTTIGTAAELLVATGHDPFARRTLRNDELRGWCAEGATAWLGDWSGGFCYLSALGEPGAVGALLEQLLPELPPRTRVTLPRGTATRLPAWVGLDGTDWDFRWLAEPPPVQAGEERVVELTDPAAVEELLTASSPTASARPGDDDVRRWVGIPGSDGLLACAADTSNSAAVGHLSSIAVHPSARGHGLGRAVTAAMTRQLFGAGCELVTLGMYAVNSVGRGLYDGLGFHDEHRFTSGMLQVRSRW